MPERMKTVSASQWCFPENAVSFLAELKENNNRTWFTEHKSVFEDVIQQPAKELCAHMCAQLEKLTGAAHVSKIFRVHRDVRFSKDKSPYKPHLHILFRTMEEPQGGLGHPAWFFGLESDRLAVGCGIFSFEKEALIAFRERVAGDDGASLDKTLARLMAQGFRLRDPELKKVPSGFPKDHPRADLLLRKGLTVWGDHSGGPAAAMSPKLIPSTIALYRKMKPVVDWLNA
ncbi:MAG: DUF2461 domain-containing protein [Pseudomonadota bacterium]